MTTDIWGKLAAKIPSDKISWRQDGKPINRDGRNVARFVCYIEAGTVRDRLDSVVPGEWDLTLAPFGQEIQFVAHEGSEVVFFVKARLQVLGVVREDIGQGQDPKAASTDAFKRAAVRFGIGHELYDMEQLWVELDGDGKYAKPVEDPQKVYERKFGKERQAAEGGAHAANAASAPEASADSTPPKEPRALDEESCPKCGGRVWDNRLTKRNPRAPDFKCRDRSCDGVIWPPKPGEKRSTAPAGASDEPEWPPLDQDDDLPF